jgi:Domain of unknown function (DUF397)
MEHRLQLLVFLQGSLAVRYRFDILRTLSLRPPTNLADERRLWQAARAVTVLPPVVAPGRPDGQHGPGAARTARRAGRDGLSGNPSGADGYWQILGQVVPGDIYDDGSADVRNSRKPDEGVLHFTPGEWHDFLAGVKNGEFG